MSSLLFTIWLNKELKSESCNTAIRGLGYNGRYRQAHLLPGLMCIPWLIPLKGHLVALLSLIPQKVPNLTKLAPDKNISGTGLGLLDFF